MRLQLTFENNILFCRKDIGNEFLS